MLFAFDFVFSIITVLSLAIFIFAFVLIFVKIVRHKINTTGENNSIKITFDEEISEPETPKELRCPYCGAPIHESDRKCEYCGSRL